MRVIKSLENPIWQDVEAKDRIIGRAVYEDGTASVLSFPVDPENEDYQQFLVLSSAEEVDTNTQTIRDKQAEERQKSVALQEERAREKRANTLFNAKIEAFEIPAVQKADASWKSRIRKATTTVEVVAITSILIMQEGLTPDETTPDETV